jgi:hypothetical protein
MSTSDASRSLLFLSDFSAKDRQLAEKTAATHDERQRKAGEALGRKAETIKEAARRQVHDLVGAKNWASLRQFMQRERLAFRDLLQPPGGLRLDRRKASDARVKKGDAFLRKFGINPRRLRTIGRETQAQLQALLAAAGKVVPGHHLPQHLGAWKKLSPLHEVALPWGEIGPVGPVDDPHRWFLFRPPFFGFNFAFFLQRSANFVVDRTSSTRRPGSSVTRSPWTSMWSTTSTMPWVRRTRRSPSASRRRRPGASRC